LIFLWTYLYPKTYRNPAQIILVVRWKLWKNSWEPLCFRYSLRQTSLLTTGTLVFSNCIDEFFNSENF